MPPCCKLRSACCHVASCSAVQHMLPCCKLRSACWCAAAQRHNACCQIASCSAAQRMPPCKLRSACLCAAAQLRNACCLVASCSAHAGVRLCSPYYVSRCHRPLYTVAVRQQYGSVAPQPACEGAHPSDCAAEGHGKLSEGLWSPGAGRRSCCKCCATCHGACGLVGVVVGGVS